VYLSKTNDALPLDTHRELLPLLLPLCRPHENPVSLCQWNLHGKNRVQFLLFGDLLSLRPLVDPIYYRHQIADQCARVHARYLNLDSYHGTRVSGFRLPASGTIVAYRPSGSLSALT
jgi:hypothetical protein